MLVVLPRNPLASVDHDMVGCPLNSLDRFVGTSPEESSCLGWPGWSGFPRLTRIGLVGGWGGWVGWGGWWGGVGLVWWANEDMLVVEDSLEFFGS